MLEITPYINVQLRFINEAALPVIVKSCPLQLRRGHLPGEGVLSFENINVKLRFIS